VPPKWKLLAENHKEDNLPEEEAENHKEDNLPEEEEEVGAE